MKISQLVRMDAMTTCGHLNNEEIRYLTDAKKMPVAAPAFYYIGDNSASMGGPGVPGGEFHPYAAYARRVSSKIAYLAPPSTNNTTYQCSFYVLEDGNAYSWGSNSLGVNGPAGSSSTVPQLLGQGPYSKIAQCGSIAASIFLKANGELWSSGYNNTGQAGRGSSTSYSFGRIGTDLWSDMSAYDENGYAVRTDGTLWSWGQNANGKTGLGLTSGNTLVPTQIGTDTDWAKVFAGRAGAFAIKTDGRLYGWGVNTNGCLGVGNANQQNAPVQVGTTAGWKSAFKSSSHSVFVHTDGTLWTAGLASNYRRGIAGTSSSNVPVQLGTETNWVDAACGPASIIAKNTNGGVWYCGSASDGVFSSDVPMTRMFRGIAANIAIAAGIKHFFIGY